MTDFAIVPGVLAGVSSPDTAAAPTRSRSASVKALMNRLTRRAVAPTATVATPPASTAVPSPATAPGDGTSGGSVAASLDVVAFGAPAGDVSSVRSTSVEIPVSPEAVQPSAAATEPTTSDAVDARTADDLTCSWPAFVKGTDLESLRWMDTPDGPVLVGRFAPPMPKNLSR